MKYIVIGGAGFIGSHLCEELSINHQVISIDDYSAGYRSNLKNPSIQQIDWDITLKPGLFSIVKKLGKIDGVFNLAAKKKNVCLENPSRDLDVNIKGSFNVAMLCRELNCKMVHASTGSVYGEAVGIQDENHPTNPVSYYGISKLAGEKYARFIANATVLRFFHVYGERQENKDDIGGVLSIWIRRIMENQPVILYGDGTQERSFTYVKDVVKACTMGLSLNGVYNVASGYRYTLNSALSVLKSIYGDFEVIKKDWQNGDIKLFEVDNFKIRNAGLTEWTNLQNGLNQWRSTF